MSSSRPAPEVLAIVPARAGSKGLPGKNIRPLAGKPLLAHSIAAARAAACVGRIIVSTDDEAYAELARHHGAEVPCLRPPELARDETTTFEVVEDLLDRLARTEGYQPTHFVLLQPTSPLRTAADVDGAWKVLGRAEAEAVVSVAPARNHPQHLRMVGQAGELRPYPGIEPTVKRRQEMPECFALNGAIYLETTEAFRKHRTFYPPRLWAWVMPWERSVDIDSHEDFRLAEWLLAEAAPQAAPECAR